VSPKIDCAIATPTLRDTDDLRSVTVETALGIDSPETGFNAIHENMCKNSSLHVGLVSDLLIFPVG
jgi:hypothetical protein